MAVLLGLSDVPDGICVDFLKAKVLALDETLKIVPLARQWRFFYRLLDTGLVITDKKVVIYSTRHFAGLKKEQEFLLKDLAGYRVTTGVGGQTFQFRLENGKAVTLTIKISAEDGQIIDQELQSLLVKLEDNTL